jgi:hypothetical protein
MFELALAFWAFADKIRHLRARISLDGGRFADLTLGSREVFQTPVY